jgi:hypothetical protein
MALPKNGDFCYVIWFDDKEDAQHFLKLIRRCSYAWLLSRSAIKEWAVIWDIGRHKY